MGRTGSANREPRPRYGRISVGKKPLQSLFSRPRHPRHNGPMDFLNTRRLAGTCPNHFMRSKRRRLSLVMGVWEICSTRAACRDRAGKVAETGKGSPRVLQRRRFIRDCPVGAVAAESFGRGNRCRVYRKRRTSPIPTSVKANRPPEGARVPEAQAEQQAASSRRE
jgi:hypothetical protein